MKEIKITTEYIKLGQFLKFAHIVSGGGEAKVLIQTGKIKVNGEICEKRGKKLRKDDIIKNMINEEEYKII